MGEPATPLSTLQQLDAELGDSGQRRHRFETRLDPARGGDYRAHFPILEGGETMAEIPATEFPRCAPHPYTARGAHYPAYSPFHCRIGVLQRLRRAAAALQQVRAGWSLEIFDAYRPLAVQRYLVEQAFRSAALSRGYATDHLPPTEAARIWHEVFSIWARPVDDPGLPPPHSTGGALDLTLLDARGNPVAMGSAIDAPGPVSLPGHFATGSDAEAREAHTNRELLRAVMHAAGFQRHPFEWWHFSHGDQLWALMSWVDDPASRPVPCYAGVG
jgi:D-alanyl-D-alanine dipeptidase